MSVFDLGQTRKCEVCGNEFKVWKKWWHNEAPNGNDFFTVQDTVCMECKNK